MARNRSWLGRGLCAVLASLAMIGHAASTDKVVGTLGHSTQITFEGNKTFSEAALRSGLRMSSEFVADSHPAAPLDAFLRRISDSIGLGHQWAGFLNATASAQINEKGTGIHVVIDEGIRVKNGRLIVEGVDAPLSALLLSGLTKDKRVKAESEPNVNRDKVVEAAWRPEDPAFCHVTAEPRLRHSARQLLRQEGWFAAEVDVRIDIKDDEATATVIVSDLGPVSVIDTIQVTGAKRNRVSAILEFLEIRSGMKITGSMIEDRRRRLYQSGRFLKSGIVMKRKTAQSIEVDLEVEVVEAKDVALIETSFSREVKAVLQAGQWLTKAQESDYDVVVSGASPNRFVFHGALSGSDGLLLAITFPEEGVPMDSDKLLAEPSDLMMILSSSRLSLQVAGVEGMWRHDTEFPIQASLRVGASGDPERPFELMMDAFASTLVKKKHALPVSLSIDPVVLAGKLASKEMTGIEPVWKGDRVVLTGTNVMLSIDTSTGRLIEMARQREGGDYSIKTERGGFDRLRKRLAPDATKNNRYDAAAPLSSSAEFLAEAFTELSACARVLDPDGVVPPHEKTSEIMEAILALIKIGILSPGDEIAKKITFVEKGDGGLPFAVPYKSGTEMAGDPNLVMIARVMGELVEGFPENSWTEPFFTELIHVAHGNTRFTKQVLDGLYQDTEHNGPVSYLIMAKVLEFQSKQESVRFAKQGLQHLSPEDFEHDWRLFVNDPVVEQLFRKFAAAAPTLEAGHRATLDGVFGEGATAAAIAHLDQLDKEGGQSLGDFVESGMTRLWSDEIRAVVKEQLESIVSPTQGPDHNVARVNGVTVPRRALIPWMGNKQMTPEKARELAINAELVYQDVNRTEPKTAQMLERQLMTMHMQVIQILEKAGTPIGSIKKTLFYQEVLRRKISQGATPTEADLRAYYTRHSAAINKPFHEVRGPLTASLTQAMRSTQLERWLRKLRDDADIKLFEIEAPPSGGDR